MMLDAVVSNKNVVFASVPIYGNTWSEQ